MLFKVPSVGRESAWLTGVFSIKIEVMVSLPISFLLLCTAGQLAKRRNWYFSHTDEKYQFRPIVKVWNTKKSHCLSLPINAYLKLWAGWHLIM